MKRLLLSMATVPLLVSGLSIGASADDGFNILSDLKLSGEIRPRYESANDSNKVGQRAEAFTARTALGVNAGLLEVDGLSSYVEVTSVNNFGATNYDGAGTGINSDPKYDVIKDPQQARLTQAYVDYKMGKTLVRAGRQDVNIDNQRFIGTVDWRQMKQTFDAVAVVDNSVANLSLLGAYVGGYIGIGEAQQATNTGSVLLHAAYKTDEMLTVTVYDYMLASISDTYGLALTGNIAAGAAKLDYRAEYAKQTDPSLEYRFKDVKADASYYNLDLGANISGVLAGVNYESLGKAEGKAPNGFYTPLATLHAFNGWADVFLGSTNNNGLNDANVRLGYADKSLGKILVVYHSYSTVAQGAGTDLGTEMDVLYANAIAPVKGLSGLIKGAYYMGGDVAGFTEDKKVVWAMLDYKF